MDLDLIIRPANGDDIAFIYSTWLRSLRYDSALRKTTQKSVFFQNYQLVLDSILNAPKTRILIACLSSDPNVIFGYLVHGPSTAHYCFVKDAFRGLKIAKTLLAEAFGNTDGTIQVTHITKTAEPIVFNNPRFSYNPFLLYKGVE